MISAFDTFKPHTFVDAFRFMADNPGLMWQKTAEHLQISGEAMGIALLVAIPLGVVAARLSLRGAPWRPAATGVSLAIGAAAVGSLLVHAACPSPSASHWLAAHALLPLATGAAVGAGVSWWLARSARRSRAVIARWSAPGA